MALTPTKGSRHAGSRWLTDPACRFLNVLVAAVALVILAPLMLLIAVLVGLGSRGPVIYRQPRVGLDRRRRSRPWIGGREEALR